MLRGTWRRAKMRHNHWVRVLNRYWNLRFFSVRLRYFSPNTKIGQSPRHAVLSQVQKKWEKKSDFLNTQTFFLIPDYLTLTQRNLEIHKAWAPVLQNPRDEKIKGLPFRRKCSICLNNIRLTEWLCLLLYKLLFHVECWPKPPSFSTIMTIVWPKS